jgi:hypothetical protein
LRDGNLAVSLCVGAAAVREADVRHQDRDRGGRHAADARGLADGARANLFELLDDLVREARDVLVDDAVGDADVVGLGELRVSRNRVAKVMRRWSKNERVGVRNDWKNERNVM